MDLSFSKSERNRLWNALVKSAHIFFYSLTLMPFLDWCRFWFTFPAQRQVSLDGIKVFIRTSSLRSKIVDLYMSVSDIIWRQYEDSRHMLGKEDVVIDIGGHIGSFALLALREKGRVIVFEPDPMNFAMLENNLKANASPNSVAVNKAVSDASGKITLFRDMSNSAAHSTTKLSGEGQEVESLSLDDIFAIYNIPVCHFMKLDCEGAEFSILSGASPETLRKIQKLSMEYHEGYDLEKLVKSLVDSGFEIIKNEPDTLYQGYIWASR